MGDHAQYWIVVAALVASIGAFVVSAAAFAAGAANRRASRQLRQEIEREFEGKIRLWMAREGAALETRLRVAADAHIKLTERVVGDAAALRRTLSSAAGAIFALATEAWKSGETARARELVEQCNEALRAASNAGPLVPPELRDPAVEMINDLQDLLVDIAGWAKLPDRDQRRPRCRLASDRMQAIAARVGPLFDNWTNAQLNTFRDSIATMDAGEAEARTSREPLDPALGMARASYAPGPGDAGQSHGDDALGPLRSVHKPQRR